MYNCPLKCRWYMHLNNNFQFLNNIIRIFILLFIHIYFQKIQTILLIDIVVNILKFLEPTEVNIQLFLLS